VANQRALQQSRRANILQYVVIVLGLLITALLTTIAMRHIRNSRRMQKLALTDDLTGVPNRRSVLSLLPKVISDKPGSTTRRHGRGYRSFQADQRHLRARHRRSRAAAHRRRAAGGCIRRNFWRIGGEEFLVVLPGRCSNRGGTRRALRLIARDADISALMPELGSLTVSIGIAISRPGESVSSILQRADMALYRAKAAGRNRVAGDDPTQGNPTLPLSRPARAGRASEGAA
jgi:GGDEF domain-containing protein